MVFAKRKGNLVMPNWGPAKKVLRSALPRIILELQLFYRPFYRANDKKVTWLNPIFKRQG